MAKIRFDRIWGTDETKTNPYLDENPLSDDVEDNPYAKIYAQPSTTGDQQVNPPNNIPQNRPNTNVNTGGIVGRTGKYDRYGKREANRVDPNEIRSYLGSLGFSRTAVAGIMANIEGESAFDSNAVGDGGMSFGLFQHNKSRRDTMVSVMKDRGMQDNDWRGQVDFAHSEMSPSLKRRLNASQTVQEAVDLFVDEFERPADRVGAKRTRGKLAVKHYAFGGYLPKPVKKNMGGYINSGGYVNSYDKPNMGLGILSGALSGAATGTAALPGWGTLAGAVVGGVASAFTGNAERKKYEDSMRKQNEQMMKYMQNQSNSILSMYAPKGTTGQIGYYAKGGIINNDKRNHLINEERKYQNWKNKYGVTEAESYGLRYLYKRDQEPTKENQVKVFLMDVNHNRDLNSEPLTLETIHKQLHPQKSIFKKFIKTNSIGVESLDLWSGLYNYLKTHEEYKIKTKIDDRDRLNNTITRLVDAETGKLSKKDKDLYNKNVSYRDSKRIDTLSKSGISLDEATDELFNKRIQPTDVLNQKLKQEVERYNKALEKNNVGNISDNESFRNVDENLTKQEQDSLEYIRITNDFNKLNNNQSEKIESDILNDEIDDLMERSESRLDSLQREIDRNKRWNDAGKEVERKRKKSNESVKDQLDKNLKNNKLTSTFNKIKNKIKNTHDEIFNDPKREGITFDGSSEDFTKWLKQNDIDTSDIESYYGLEQIYRTQQRPTQKRQIKQFIANNKKKGIYGGNAKGFDHWMDARNYIEKHPNRFNINNDEIRTLVGKDSKIYKDQKLVTDAEKDKVLQDVADSKNNSAITVDLVDLDRERLELTTDNLSTVNTPDSNTVKVTDKIQRLLNALEPMDAVIEERNKKRKKTNMIQFAKGGYLPRYAQGRVIEDPEYEVERGEVVQGADAQLEDSEQIASDLHLVKGNPHADLAGTQEERDNPGVYGEGGERVFSDRLPIGNDLRKLLNESGFKKAKSKHTFAEIAKLLGEIKGRNEEKLASDDYISKNTGETMLGKINNLLDITFEVQEMQKEQEGVSDEQNGQINPSQEQEIMNQEVMSEAGMFAKGGRLPKYAWGKALDFIKDRDNLGYLLSGASALVNTIANSRMQTRPPVFLQNAPAYLYQNRSGLQRADNRATYRNFANSEMGQRGISNQLLYANMMKQDNQIAQNENVRRDAYNQQHVSRAEQIQANNLANMQRGAEADMQNRNAKIKTYSDINDRFLSNVNTIAQEQEMKRLKRYEFDTMMDLQRQELDIKREEVNLSRGYDNSEFGLKGMTKNNFKTIETLKINPNTGLTNIRNSPNYKTLNIPFGRKPTTSTPLDIFSRTIDNTSNPYQIANNTFNNPNYTNIDNPLSDNVDYLYHQLPRRSLMFN